MSSQLLVGIIVLVGTLLTIAAYITDRRLNERALQKVLTDNPDSVQGVGSLEFKLGSFNDIHVIGSNKQEPDDKEKTS